MLRPALRLALILAALGPSPELSAQDLTLPGEGWILPPGPESPSLIPNRPDTAAPQVDRDRIRRLIIARLRLGDPQTRAAVLRQARCLAYAVYFEAQGEARLGQLGVAQVVMNRLRHPAYPKTICAVISDRDQFPWVTGDLTIRDPGHFRIAWSVALHMMAGIFTDPTGGATHFYAPARVAAPAWATPEAHRVTIGGHQFFQP